MGKKVSRGSEQFVLRLPDGMRDRLKNLAAENGRSVNAEIIARLEDYETLETRFAELAKRAAHNEGRASGHLEAVKLMASILADAAREHRKEVMPLVAAAIRSVIDVAEAGEAISAEQSERTLKNSTTKAVEGLAAAIWAKKPEQ